MFGDKPSIADLSLAGEVTALVAFEYPFAADFPQVQEWFNEMLKIPSFKRVHEEGKEKLSLFKENMTELKQAKM